MTSSDSQHVKLAIALLCYNNRDLLEKFIPVVLRTMPKSDDVKLFVIDNASTDTTQAYLKEFKDDITVIRIEKNRGFTNGYKDGLSQIKADLYCLLSSDIEVSEGWVEPVLNLFDEQPNVAVIQPKIKSWHKKSDFEYAGAAGGFIDYQGYPFCRGRIFYTTEEDEGQYDSNEEIFWASGACFFIRAELYHSSGGLDNDFFAHMEEIDLCWRLKNLGHKVMVCSSSEVYHIGGAVIAYGSPEKVFRNHRNNLIMMLKNLPPSEVFTKIFARLFMDALAFVNMVMRGQIKASFSIIHAHWSFFLSLNKWMKKRRQIQKHIKNYSKTAIYPNSIVLDYFLRDKKKFSDLNWP